MERVYILKADVLSYDDKDHYTFVRTIDIARHIKRLQLNAPYTLILTSSYTFNYCSKLKAYIRRYLNVYHVRDDWFELSQNELVGAQREMQEYIDRENIVN